jgi:multidrug transporter EmrE-like cation transporter
MKVLIFICYLASMLYGLYALKVYEAGLSLSYVFGLFVYVLGFMIWLIILKLYPLSLAFPIAAGALIVGTQLVGVLALGEKLVYMKAIGAVVILIGIVMMAIGERISE